MEWNNAYLLKGHPVDEVTRLRRQPGQNLLLFGSANLATSLIKES